MGQPLRLADLLRRAGFRVAAPTATGQGRFHRKDREGPAPVERAVDDPVAKPLASCVIIKRFVERLCIAGGTFVDEAYGDPLGNERAATGPVDKGQTIERAVA